LGGEAIVAKLIRFPVNNAPIRGNKVVTENEWLAVGPSGIEEVLRIYVENYRGRKHLRQIQNKAKAMTMAGCRAAGV